MYGSEQNKIIHHSSLLNYIIMQFRYISNNRPYFSKSEFNKQYWTSYKFTNTTTKLKGK
mgnify:CR=1 FL=1